MMMDPVVILAAGLAGTLLACVAVFFIMRDRGSSPPRRFRLTTTCPQDGKRAVVDILEERRSGMMMRTVLRCSLREHGAHCHEQCCWHVPA
jgi:hypothetical protein